MWDSTSYQIGISSPRPILHLGWARSQIFCRIRLLSLLSNRIKKATKALQEKSLRREGPRCLACILPSEPEFAQQDAPKRLTIDIGYRVLGSVGSLFGVDRRRLNNRAVDQRRIGSRVGFFRSTLAITSTFAITSATMMVVMASVLAATTAFATATFATTFAATTVAATAMVSVTVVTMAVVTMMPATAMMTVSATAVARAVSMNSSHPLMHRLE